MKKVIYAMAAVLILSCSKDSDSELPQDRQAELGTVTLKLNNVLTDKSSFSSKSAANRTIQDATEYPYCTDEVLNTPVEPGTGYNLTYIAELFNNGVSIGHRMSIINKTSVPLTNVTVVGPGGGTVYTVSEIPAETRHWFVATQNVGNGMSFTADGGISKGTASVSGATKEVCDLKPACDFPEIPLLNVPNSFTVRFYRDGEDALIFTGLTEGVHEFEIPLDFYTQVVVVSGELNTYDDGMVLSGGVQNVDFSTTARIDVTVSPQSGLVLVAKDNLDAGVIPSIQRADNSNSPEQLYDFGNYWGIFALTDTGGILTQKVSFTDTQGNEFLEVIDPFNQNTIYRFLVCPDAEVGIQLEENLFEDMVDVVLD